MAQVTVEVTRTRVVRERLTVSVDTDLWESTFKDAFDGPEFDLNTVAGWKVEEYVRENDATPVVKSTDIGEDVWSNVTFPQMERVMVDGLTAARYAYCRAHIWREEAEQALARAGRAEHYAQLEFAEADETMGHYAGQLAVAQTLALNG